MTDPRSHDLAKIRQNGSFDVIVVGGGINGIGTFRDLALQGLRVLLVERDDFCSGCSAAPSRMIHGGLRYLENGEFNLVRESLFERDALLRNAPHMVFPLPTAVPVNSVFSGLLNASMSFFGMKGRPRPRGILPIKLGLSLYDVLTRKRRALPPHHVFGRAEALSLWPDLSPDIRFAAVYHDAWISHPERLGMELVLDAEEGNGQAIALNYAEIARTGAASPSRTRRPARFSQSRRVSSSTPRGRGSIKASRAWAASFARNWCRAPRARTLFSRTRRSWRLSAAT